MYPALSDAEQDYVIEKVIGGYTKNGLAKATVTEEA